MAINLQKGQRISLEKSMTHALVGLGWDTNRYDGGADFDLDASVFLLGENDKLLRDEDFVFYNNLSGRDGAVVHMGDNLTGGSDGDDEQIKIDFTKLPPEIKKIAICVTIYDADLRRQNFGQVSNAYIRIARLSCENDEVGETVLRFALRRNSPSRQHWSLQRSITETVNGSSMPLHQAIRVDWQLFAAHSVQMSDKNRNIACTVSQCRHNLSECLYFTVLGRFYS